MKIYDDKLAPNPRRVRVFLAEKGIDVPYEQVSIMKGQHKTPEFRKKSPLSQLPALELDDGTVITETVAICRYFEELHPEPPLMGTTPLEKAQIEMWQRRMELSVMMPVAMSFRHTFPGFAALENQIKEWGELNKERALGAFKWLDKQLAGKQFVAGDKYTIADITGLCTVDFAKFAGIEIPEDCQNLKAWYERVAARPSAKA